MKYLLTILFSVVLQFSANSQSLTVYDLCILEDIHEIAWVNYYLTANKDFKFLGNYGKNDGGWEVYKFSRGQDILEVNIASKTIDGEFYEVTQLIYSISSESGYDLFFKSLMKYKFEKKKEIRSKNNIKSYLWSGTLNPHDYLTMLWIGQVGKKHIISL